ncbi:MAG: hypothetical protein ACYTFA_11005 [Planctomycetota bacterium]|jgi:HAMP domain-containing protein
MDTTKTKRPSGNDLRQRRKHIINPLFQWKYTLLISGSVFFVSMFISVILFGALNAQVRTMHLDPRASHMWETTLVMAVSAVAFSVLTAGAIGFWSIFLTHRVAGPVFVLERYFREIIAGRLPHVRALRKKDEFKELHDTFSRAVTVMKARYRAELTALTETLETARSSTTGEAARQGDALTEIAGRIEELRVQAAGLLGEQAESVPTESNEPCEATSNSDQPCVTVST